MLASRQQTHNKQQFCAHDAASNMAPRMQKETAIAYFNSNCNTERNEIVKQLMKISKIPIHAYGKCLQNRQVSCGTDPRKCLVSHILIHAFISCWVTARQPCIHSKQCTTVSVFLSQVMWLLCRSLL